MAAMDPAGGDAGVPSFRADGEKFVRGNFAVFASGVLVKKSSGKLFRVDPSTIVLHDVIGRGASSVVRRAVHTPTQTPLALKIFSIHERDKREQLVSELAALYDSDCEALIRLFGAFYSADGTISVALEYMNGGSLSTVVKKLGPIPEHVLAGVAFQTLWGLAYLKHEKRLHRDLKLSNILISLDGCVKLTDFGMSKELADSLALARSFKGTSTHMAPERIRHGSYSFAADMWSFGVCLLECATGVNPYAGHGSYIATCDAILSQEPPTATGRSGAAGHPLSAAFGDFVGHCLRKDPAARVPAEVLLAAPWLVRHGVTSLSAARTRVRTWIELLSSKGVDAANTEAIRAGAAAEAAAGPVVAAPATTSVPQTTTTTTTTSTTTTSTTTTGASTASASSSSSS